MHFQLQVCTKAISFAWPQTTKKQCRPGNEQGEEVNHHENDDARCLFSSDKCEHTRSLRAAGAGDPDGGRATGWKNSGRSEASARKGGRRIS